MQNQIDLINADCLRVMPALGPHAMAFADPPDNIGLEYDGYQDSIPVVQYAALLKNWLYAMAERAPVVWVSFNAKWLPLFGHIVLQFCNEQFGWEFKPGVQTFTFGTNRTKWLTNGHRPLWCVHKTAAKFYPEQILVESWRQQHGDKRAKPGGRIPDDVFDFPRVVGNSAQRRKWHNTQLHEGLLERIIRLSTREGDSVLDICAGTGTTGRVCKRINRRATLLEQSAKYCSHIGEELQTPVLIPH